MYKQAIKIVVSFCFLVFANQLTSQNYPIEVNILLAPPYPTNLDAYADFLEQGLFEINNTNSNSLEVYFDVLIEETSGKIKIDSEGALATPITIEPGSNILSPSDIQDIFEGTTEDNFTTAGLSTAERDAILLNRQMPEGEYRICLRAQDEFGQALSDPSLEGCTVFEAFFAERPVIMYPPNGAVLEDIEIMDISWDHQLSNLMALNRTEYIVKLFDITEQSIPLSDVSLEMLNPSASPDYEENVENVNFITLRNDWDFPMITGHQYAVRVTAIDPDEEIAYQFGGHSEIVVFTYGEEAEEEDEEPGLVAAPVISSPDQDEALDEGQNPLEINISWTHQLEDEDLAEFLDYDFKIIDMTEALETNIDHDDFDDLDIFWEGGLNYENKDTLLLSDSIHVLKKEHEYALLITVSSEDDRIKFANDGKSKIVTFTMDQKEKEEDAEEGCGGKCLEELPTDQIMVEAKTGDKLFFGKHIMTVEEINKKDDGTQYGKGFVSINLVSHMKINVSFEDLKANKAKRVFEGEAKGIFDDKKFKADGLIAAGVSSFMDKDLENAGRLASALRNGNKLASLMAGSKTDLPIGIDRKLDGDTLVVGITEMNFSPTKATLTALFNVENPDWGDYIPTLGATDICFTRSGFGDVVKLFLGNDYNIPFSNEQLTLKASEENTSEEKGTYCIVDCKGFLEGQITAELGIPRKILLPELEDGSIDSIPSNRVKLTLSGTFFKGNQYVLSASLSPCQIPGIEGFSLTATNGHYDASDETNPTGIKFPTGYLRSETDKTWRGVWFENIELKAPIDWGFSGEEERTSIAIKNFIKDQTGISVVGSAKNLLSIDKGEIEGFAISIDEINLNIIQGQFDQTYIKGKLGMPILPDEKYLDYKGIVQVPKEDQSPTQQGANAAAGEKMELLFQVTPDEEGYDIDWLKAHIDFDENSQFILANNSKQRGFKATLSGTLTLDSTSKDLNDKRDTGLPEISVPGLSFEGMEISRMIDKVDPKDPNQKANTGKNNTGGFTWKSPSISFLGMKISELTGNGQGGIGNENEEENIQEEEESKATMNGFSLNIDEIGFTNEEDEELKKFENGKKVNLNVVTTVALVKGKNNTNKNQKDKGLAISATGGFKISSLVEKSDNKTSIKFDNFGMDSLIVDAKISAFGINGKVGFYQEDPIFGNGALGNFKVELPIANINLDGRFGSKKDFNYWYLFGDITSGEGKSRKPFATFQQVINLYGFNGGLYYHMKDKGGTRPENRYVPDKNTLIGLEAGLTLSVTRPEVLWGNITLGAEINTSGGLNLLKLRGDCYALKSDMEPRDRAKNKEVEGIEAFLDARLNFKTDSPEFTSTLDMYANVSEGLIKGNLKDGQPYQVVKSMMEIKDGNWSMFMGKPSKPGSVLVGIEGFATVQAQAYLMMGKGVEFEAPTLNPYIEGLLNRGRPDKFSASLATGSENNRKSDGFAFGMNLDYKLDIKASILYAEFRAMFGFDLSLIQQPGVTCANTGGDEIGLGGWYANGQIYAGLSGDMGLDVDLWFYTGKVSLAQLYAVLLIQGGAPNPVWARGTANMGFEVLGGLLKGNASFDVEVGEKCEKEVSNPFINKSFIADIDPGNSASNVNVFVNPRVSYENKLGKYEIVAPTANGNVLRTFDIRLEEYSLSGPEGKVSMSPETSWDYLNTLLRTTEMLKPKSKYTLKVSVGVYELKNGIYAKLLDKNNKHVTETKEVSFTTGLKPDYLSTDNIKLTYPFIGEKYYLKAENLHEECYLKMDKADNDLWKSITPAGQQWHSKVVGQVYEKYGNIGKKLVHQANLELKNYGKEIIFSLPSNKLANGKTYYIQLTRVHYQNSRYNTSGTALTNKAGTGYTYERKGKSYQNYTSNSPKDKYVFGYSFTVSKYNSFHEKLEGKTYTIETRTPTNRFDGNGVEYVILNDEPFSTEELMQRYISSNQDAYGGIIRVIEYYDSTPENPYYNLFRMLRLSQSFGKDLRRYYQKNNSSPPSHNFKFDWEKAWRFNNNKPSGGFVYDDQINKLMKMPYHRDDARFWFNTLDLMGDEDINNYGIWLMVWHGIIGYKTEWQDVFKESYVNYKKEGIEYSLEKPRNARKYKVHMSYYPPYFDRSRGYIRTRQSAATLKEF